MRSSGLSGSELLAKITHCGPHSRLALALEAAMAYGLHIEREQPPVRPVKSQKQPQRAAGAFTLHGGISPSRTVYPFRRCVSSGGFGIDPPPET